MYTKNFYDVSVYQYSPLTVFTFRQKQSTQHRQDNSRKKTTVLIIVISGSNSSYRPNTKKRGITSLPIPHTEALALPI